MKKLGQLQVGDTFYLINYDEGDHISDVCEKVVSIITDIAIGKIVKYLDAEGILHGITVTKDEFDSGITYVETMKMNLENLKKGLKYE